MTTNPQEVEVHSAPPRSQRWNQKYPFDTLEVGASFTIIGMKDTRQITSVCSYWMKKFAAQGIKKIFKATMLDEAGNRLHVGRRLAVRVRRVQ